MYKEEYFENLNLEDKNMLVRVEDYNDDYEHEEYFLMKGENGKYEVYELVNTHIIHSQIHQKKDLIDICKAKIQEKEILYGYDSIRKSFCCEILEYFKTKKRHIEDWS